MARGVGVGGERLAPATRGWPARRAGPTWKAASRVRPALPDERHGERSEDRPFLGAARGRVARGCRGWRPGLKADGVVRSDGFMSEVAIV
jgi:hypothetical protein